LNPIKEEAMSKAILSTYDKSGLLDFACGLKELDWTLIASGGTARFLMENKLPVIEVADYTGSPEILSGRVKTLHPAIHAGILARPNENDRDELQELGWDYIDLVAVNLYPFEQTIAKPGVSLEEAIENIDIGGVTLMRAAAKNYTRVTLLSDPADYLKVLGELQAGGVSLETRRQLAVKGFRQTTIYDTDIAAYLGGSQGDQPLVLKGYPVQRLRYGENPHQAATLYSFMPGEGPLGGKVLQGKELSFTNLLDLDAAWKTVLSFEKPTICIVKHVSPCGIASNTILAEAFTAALASDPVSAFGGVIASNRIFDEATVLAMGDLFTECIISPGFTVEARNLLSKRKNCRLMEMPSTSVQPNFDLRSVMAGFLKQDIDLGDPAGTEWKVVSQRQPEEAEIIDLHFAWKACQHVRSNAIVFAQGEATVGIGGGQPNRVDSVRIAVQRAGKRARGAVMASDAFFPFADSVNVAAQAGISAIVQTGGSIRDAESIAAADAAGMSMIITGVRHFKH
jgi:phosphoribosylaminoimidazolecarboxamide formyltransferase/IMP cyclohydrolase